MIKYPTDYNPIMEYWERIRSGEITAGDKIRRTYKKLAYDIENPGEYYYSSRRANHILEFAENYCRQTKGKYGGQLVRLELWEKALLAAVFGFVDIEGNRKYREAVLIVGKKNGKSLIASVVGLYMLIADGEPGPEVYATATHKDQAKIVWSEAKRMAVKSPTLRKRVTPHVADLMTDFNDGIFKPLASDSDTLDGLNVHCSIMDEIHQWKNGKSLYNIMADGVTAREQPLVLITSTAGTIREDIYDEKYDYASMVINGYEDRDGYKDERFIAFIYEIDRRSEWTDERCWYKANPGLGTIKNLTTLRAKVDRAKENPDMVKNLVCKEFNVRETSAQAWLTFEDADNRETFDIRELRPRYGIGGTDLSKAGDLTAAKVLFMVPEDPTIYQLSMYWIPEDSVGRHVREDKVPYDIWIERGFVRSCPGNTVHPKYVTEWFREMRDKYDIWISWVGYDAWSAAYWVEEMQAEFGPGVMVPVAQGKKTLSGPMHALKADLRGKRLNYNSNPVDRWCFCNTAVDVDRNGNIQPMKTDNPRRRIDGTAATLDAYVVLQDRMNEYMNLI